MSKSKTNGTPTKGKRSTAAVASKLSLKKTAAKMTAVTLEELFEEELKQIYNAEKQLLAALPQIAEAACSTDLYDAFLDHYDETERQIERLEEVFSRLQIQPEEKECKAMKGLIAEVKQVIQQHEEGSVRDAALIIGSQKIEHYEIAVYGSLCEFANVLDYTRILELLHYTLEEEEATDEFLTHIARDVNEDAYELSHEEELERVY